MKYTIRGFLVTAAIWAGLIAAYSGIELYRGHVPFEMMKWEIGGRFVTIVFTIVMALGTAVGFASDRLQRQRASR